MMMMKNHKRMHSHKKKRRPLKSCNQTQFMVGLLLVIGLLLCCVNCIYFFYSVHRNDKETPPSQQTSRRQELIQGKERILEILSDAGIFVEDMSDKFIQQLPLWETVVKLYGDTPRIYGLETCKDYQNIIPPYDAAVAPAGAFNSGTNLLAELLIHNCHIPARMQHYGAQNRGIRWQVNWGKHTPPELRTSHKTYSDGKVSNEALLPAVTIRDPYIWLHSMCRHNYATQWFHDDAHCPNLVPNQIDRAAFQARDYPNDCEKPQHATNFTLEAKEVPVRVNYAPITKYHRSLAHMWNDWYNDYWNADFPRLIVRFEDLMFFAKNVTTEVCHCAGGELNRGKFQYITESAKKGTKQHGSVKTNFMEALVKYGNAKDRFEKMDKNDLEYARTMLDPKLMEYFGYKHYGEEHEYKAAAPSRQQQQSVAFQQQPPYKNMAASLALEQRNHVLNDEDPVITRLRASGASERVLQDPNIRAQLPTWSQVTALYGTEPKIVGLETCQAFQENVPALDRHLGAAGMFNTGTNLITMLLKANCIIPERYEHYGPNATKEQYGMRWQVPWGKHTPADRRLHHHATKAAAIIKEHVLPIVLIRDPYNWMSTMCRHSYSAKWPHDSSNYCPHLAHYDGTAGYIPVDLKFANDYRTHHDSLAHLWNDWNMLYMEAEYPRLMIRFEDVIFFQKEVTTQVCHCAGGIIRKDRPFHHLVDSAKDGPGHGALQERTGMVDAWIKYGKPPKPFAHLEDVEAAKQILNPTLLQTFGYDQQQEQNNNN